MRKLWLNYRVTLVIYGFFLLLSFVFIFPLSSSGVVYNGDDVYYHILRIDEIAKNIQHGNLFPAINTYTFKQIGYPVNLFYPWITLIPFAVFRTMINNQVTSVYAGFFFYTFLTLCITYIVGKRFSHNRLQAVIMAGTYVFAAYHVIDAFTRFALGEYLAMSFLPLCFYGFYAVMYGNKRDWPFLAIGGILIVLSHVLSALIVSLFLGIIWIVSLYWVRDRMKKTILLLFSGVVTFLGSSIFMLPFLEQELFQNFKQPSPQPLIPENFDNIFLSSLNNNLNRSIDGGHYNIGFVLIFSIFLGLILFKELNKNYRIIYLVGVYSFIMLSNLFPWNIVTNTPLNIIQFPFRLLIIPTFMLSVVFSKLLLIVVDRYTTTSKVMKIILTLVFFTGLSVLPYSANIYRFTQGSNASGTSSGIVYTKNTTNKIVENHNLYLDQYTPEKALSSLNDVVNHIAIIDDKKEQVKVYPAPNALTFSNKGLKKATHIDLPMTYYKNLRIYSNGKWVPVKRSVRGTIKVNSISRESITIKYIFSTTDKLGVVISLMTWILLVIYGIWNKFKIVEKINSKRIVLNSISKH